MKIVLIYDIILLSKIGGGKKVEGIKAQLRLVYPFLRKTGIVHTSCDVNEIIERNRGEKLLIIMIGVQGSGKTTYCKKHFSKYPVINLDDIFGDCLRKNKNKFPEEVDKEVEVIFFDRLEKGLEQEKIAVVDAGSMHINFRVLMLERLQGKFTKAILIVLNPAKKQIIKQVRGQMDLRARPGLWNDIDDEYEFLNQQIRDHILEMGVDEVYMV